jgi:hypothetical protein
MSSDINKHTFDKYAHNCTIGEFKTHDRFYGLVNGYPKCCVESFLKTSHTAEHGRYNYYTGFMARYGMYFIVCEKCAMKCKDGILTHYGLGDNFFDWKHKYGRFIVKMGTNWILNDSCGILYIADTYYKSDQQVFNSICKSNYYVRYHSDDNFFYNWRMSKEDVLKIGRERSLQ